MAGCESIDNVVDYLDNQVVDPSDPRSVMPVVRASEHRRTETPNAVMTTYASPTLGGASTAVWHVVMRPGQEGPLHSIDSEQVWTVIQGAAALEVGLGATTLRPGDSAVLPADVLRRVSCASDDGFEAIVAAPAGAWATLPDGTNRGVPPWIT